MIEGWRPREDSDDLRFGIEYHYALEENDRQRAAGEDWLIAIRNVVRDLLIRTKDWKTEHQYKNRSNLLRSVVWYLDKFKDDPAETYMLADGRPAVEVSFSFELGWGPGPVTTINHGTMYERAYVLCGHLDRIVNYQGTIYVMDRKTTKSEPSSWFFSSFEPDNQMTLYTLATQVILKAPIKGVIIDAAQVQIDETRFGRGFTFRQKEHIEEWLEDLKFYFAQAEDYAAEGRWPMNDKFCGTYRSEASGKTGCPFREICSQTPRLRPNFLKSNFVQLPPEERWNPLKPR